MQKIHIEPGNIDINIKATPSKSMTQRAVFASMLADGSSKIFNPSFSEDCKSALEAAKLLGAIIKYENEYIEIHGFDIQNPGFYNDITINCGESGLAMRMLSGICGLFKSKVTLTGKGTLIRRNMFNVENSMNQTGAECSSNEGFPPLIIKGEIKPGNYLLDFYDSSQFLSGLLTAMPVFESDSEITVVNLQSKPYISMTLEILSRFGIKIINNNFQTFYIPGNQTYRAADVWIEGDWSGAAFMFVAGAIAGRAEISELNPESNQADRQIIEALRISGANIECINDKYLITKSDLNGFSFDCSDCPDLFPPLAVLACGCRGLSELIGVNRLRNKESDRAEALVAELGKIGAKIRIEKNSLIIDGNERLTGGDADSRGDHRIAMALAVAGLISENGVDINNPDCVNKSYPGFFQELTYNSFILL